MKTLPAKTSLRIVETFEVRDGDKQSMLTFRNGAPVTRYRDESLPYPPSHSHLFLNNITLKSMSNGNLEIAFRSPSTSTRHCHESVRDSFSRRRQPAHTTPSKTSPTNRWNLGRHHKRLKGNPPNKNWVLLYFRGMTLDSHHLTVRRSLSERSRARRSHGKEMKITWRCH